MSIEQRRHDAQRLKRNRAAYKNISPNPTPKAIGKALHTAAACSCWMCGNPRKFDNRLTIQERRMFQT